MGNAHFDDVIGSDANRVEVILSRTFPANERRTRKSMTSSDFALTSCSLSESRMTSVMTSRPPARFAAAGTLKGAALDRYKYQSGHVTTHAR